MPFLQTSLMVICTGASIAINGTCLTVASMGPASAGEFVVEFDVMQVRLVPDSFITIYDLCIYRRG